MNQSLLESVKRFQEGDDQAFDGVYAQSFQRIRSGLVYILKDEALAEDLTQETFLKIHQSISQLEKPENYLSWANTIAVRQAQSHLRKMSSQEIPFTDLTPATEEADDRSFEDQLESDKDFEQPEKALEEKETRRLIREIIDDLPDRQRAAIIMFYYNDMKIREIADSTGANENAIKQSLFQGKKHIRQRVMALEKQGLKLHSLSPFAFFLWLLKMQEASSVGGAVALGAATATTAGVIGAAGSTGAAMAGTAAGAAGTGLLGWFGGLSAGVKAALIGIAGAAVVGAGTAVILPTIQKNAEAKPNTVISSEAVTESSEAETRSASPESTSEETDSAEESSISCAHMLENGESALEDWVEETGEDGQKSRSKSCSVCGEVIEKQIWTVTEAGHYEKTYKTVHHDAVTHEEDVLGEVWTADPDGSFHQERAVTAYTDHDLTKFYVMTVDGNEVHPDLTDEQKFEMGGDGWQNGNVNDYFASLPVPEHALKADGPLIPSANGYRIAESWLEGTWGQKDGFQMQTPCWYWYGAYLVADGTTETRVTGTKTVVDKEAWDETVEGEQVWIEEKGYWEDAGDENRE